MNVKNQPKMDKWDNRKKIKNQKFLGPIKIIVQSERDKEQLLLAIEYLHYSDIDTDYIAVNHLVHMYEHPELIIVEPLIEKIETE